MQNQDSILTLKHNCEKKLKACYNKLQTYSQQLEKANSTFSFWNKEPEFPTIKGSKYIASLASHPIIDGDLWYVSDVSNLMALIKHCLIDLKNVHDKVSFAELALRPTYDKIAELFIDYPLQAFAVNSQYISKTRIYSKDDNMNVIKKYLTYALSVELGYDVTADQHTAQDFYNML